MTVNVFASCRKRGVPVRLVNARLSPRSERRYRKVAACVRPVFGMLDAVAAQEPADIARWEALGVPRGRITITGSSKFDPGAARKPAQRPEFAAMLESFGKDRPVVLAASTHAGEESWIGSVVKDSDAFYAVVPRHAERRAEVQADLEKAGFEVVLRSAFHRQSDPAKACLVIDSTGELSDWTAHATVVVIGKTILATGGQNPAEAILARRPVVFGHHMENFEPLASSLVANSGAIRFHDEAGLKRALRDLLDNPALRSRTCDHAAGVLHLHDGATGRILDLLDRPALLASGT